MDRCVTIFVTFNSPAQEIAARRPAKKVQRAAPLPNLASLVVTCKTTYLTSMEEESFKGAKRCAPEVSLK